MPVWQRILQLRQSIREQESLMNRNGGDLVSYIARFGDPGVAPRDVSGNPRTVRLSPREHRAWCEDLLPVPGHRNVYYVPHDGDGGNAIYRADMGRLERTHYELDELECRHHSSKILADEEETRQKHG